MSVWRSIAEAIRAGEDPVVELSYAKHLYVAPPKKKGPKPGKPRLSFAWNSTSPLGVHKRRRCMNPHCRVLLKQAQDLVCNDRCFELALEHFEAAVHVLRARGIVETIEEEIPDVQVRGISTAALHAAGDPGAGTTGLKKNRPRGRRPKGAAARYAARVG